MTFAQPFADYEILDRVGAGAMGTVFKARHKKLNRIVALKVLKPSLARDSRYVDRLKREARIVASLSHPNIVTGFDLGEEAGYHYFVMEFVEGKSLRALLGEWGMFPETYVLRVARAVAQALDHAYQRGVIHRDIKPGNILIDDTGSVKLTDMGLAKGPADLTLTRDGATVGTPQYISPEQARNPHDVDVRTDLYSLGATLYHMATGVPPFRGDTMAELITNVLHELPVSPRAINSALSEGMSLVIRKLLAKDLTVRYQTPRDLLDDLDRIEKSLPPQIDPARLSAEEGERARLWPRVLLVVGLPLLLGCAWWLGMQMHEPGSAPATPGEYFAALDAELAALATPGARLARLRAAPPVVGGELELQARLRALDAELQRAVDGVAAAFEGEGWTRLAAWLRDPSVWPDLQRALQERLRPRLLEATGYVEAQLPPSVARARLDALIQQIDRELAARDAELEVHFDEFLSSRLPAEAARALARQDFAAAARAWDNAVATFFDGVVQPLPEKLRGAMAKFRSRFATAHGSARTSVIEPEEQRVDAALRAEVAAACSELAAQLHADVDPETVERQLQLYRERLEQFWPPARSFQPGRNPWADVERQLGGVQLAVQAAIAQRSDTRFANRMDLAWRTLCHGRAVDALAVLPAAGEVAPAHAPLLERHRAALAAAVAVEHAIAQAIWRGPPTVAFLRSGSAEAVDVRAEPEGATVRLLGQTLNQPPRALRLGELRFSDLLRRLQERDPFAALSPADRALGDAVWRMVGDELDGLAGVWESFAHDDEQFLTEHVWKRIRAVRDELPEAPLDRRSLFEDLKALREAARQRGDKLVELEAALRQCEHVVPSHERSDAEDAELRAARQLLAMARRQATLQRDLAARAPRGVAVAVRVGGAQLDALDVEIDLGAAVLTGNAADWQLRGDALEFAGSGPPWSEYAATALRVDAGLEATALHTSVAIDLRFPPAAIGRRFWVLEFRGIAFVLAFGANDAVHAALVEGDLQRQENVQKAFAKALAGVMGPSRATLVPGGVHRLTIEVDTTSQRAWARIRVVFEDAELLAAPSQPLDPQRTPTFALYPQQELAVHRIVVRARGL